MQNINQKSQNVLNSPEFKKLVTTRWSVSLTLTIIILVIYIGFLLIVAFNKEILAIKIGDNFTLAIPIGLGIIFTAWILTGIYVYWANNSYDTSVENIKKNLNA